MGNHTGLLFDSACTKKKTGQSPSDQHEITVIDEKIMILSMNSAG